MVPVLLAKNLTVRFGGLVAVRDAAVEVKPKFVLGIIGPNGAGKTTFFNALTGHQAIDSGNIEFLGVNIAHMAAHQRARMGLARTFQLGGVIDELTAVENVVLGLDHGNRSRGERQSRRNLVIRSMEFLERFSLLNVANELVDNLPIGTRRQIEIARAIASGAHLVLLDEPSAGLTENERKELGEVIRQLASEGKSFVIIDHSTDLVFSACDEVNVMNFGQMIARGSPDEIKENPAVMEAYLGRTAEQVP